MAQKSENRWNCLNTFVRGGSILIIYMTFIYLFFYQTLLSCFLSKGIESTCRHCSTLSDCRGIVLVCSSFFFHC